MSPGARHKSKLCKHVSSQVLDIYKQPVCVKGVLHPYSFESRTTVVGRLALTCNEQFVKLGSLSAGLRSAWSYMQFMHVSHPVHCISMVTLIWPCMHVFCLSKIQPILQHIGGPCHARLKRRSCSMCQMDSSFLACSGEQSEQHCVHWSSECHHKRRRQLRSVRRELGDQPAAG